MGVLNELLVLVDPVSVSLTLPFFFFAPHCRRLTCLPAPLSATTLRSLIMAPTLSRNRSASHHLFSFFSSSIPWLLTSHLSILQVLSDLLEWKCLQSRLGFYSKAKTFMGMRLAVPSWSDCFVAVSKDRFFFFKSVDEVPIFFRPPPPPSIPFLPFFSLFIGADVFYFFFKVGKTPRLCL